VVLIGGWYLISRNSTPSTTPVTTTAPQTTTPTTGTSTPTTAAATITYTDTGFSPAILTVAEGTTVTFVNQSSSPLWVASDPHPTHQGYDGTTLSQHCAPGYSGPIPFDECTTIGTGNSYTFTFTKAGTWGYHNHALESDQGTVVVTASTTASGSVNLTM
jgi:plastocyanin